MAEVPPAAALLGARGYGNSQRQKMGVGGVAITHGDCPQPEGPQILSCILHGAWRADLYQETRGKMRWANPTLERRRGTSFTYVLKEVPSSGHEN
jgi:hypothetical protein